MTSDPTGLAARPTVAVVGYWALVGALAAFGTVALLTIGIFFLAAAAALTVLGIMLKLDARGLPGMLIGAATAPFVIAVLNRSGPGWVCTRTATATSCSEQWNPWWFVAAGVAMVAVGAILLLWRTRPPALGGCGRRGWGGSC